MKQTLLFLFLNITLVAQALNPISDFYQRNNINAKSILMAMSPTDCGNCILPVDELLKKIRTLNSTMPIYIISENELSPMEKVLFENKLGIGLMNIQFAAHPGAYDYLISKKDGIPSICYVSETSKILYPKNLKDDDLEKLFKLISSQTHNQSFYSEYITIHSTFSKVNYSPNEDEKIIPMLDVFSSANITAKYKLCIYSDCNYAYIKAILLEVNMPGIPLGEESAEIYLLDYNKYIFYDLKKMAFSIYKDPDHFVQPENNTIDSIYNSFIISKANPKDSARITFNKSLPKCLTNKVILIGSQDGIQEVQTKSQYLKLTLFKPNAEFDLNEKVKFAKTKCLEETKSKNYLFVK